VGNNDVLSQWAQGLPGSFFDTTGDPSVAGEFGRIMGWVQAQAQYQPAAKAHFARGADGWLVAYAKTQGLTVVTEEKPNAVIQRKVPIPNVCTAIGVNWIDTFDMLRALGVAFR
jgi:hypothetical protein